MANMGEISVALTLDDAALLAGLDAARASVEGFAGELSQLSLPPGLLGEGLLPGEEMASAFAGAGASLAQACASGLAAGAPAVSAGAASLMDAALRSARSGASGANSIGAGFAAGLASGIASGRSGVISAAVSVARAAASAARSALAIHSPSRVTEELGELFDRGFIEGVEGMTPEVKRAVRTAVEVEPPASALRVRGEQAAPARAAAPRPIDYDALADAMDRRQVALYMGRRQVAQVMTDEIGRTQAAYNRRIAMGYGGR